MRVWIGLCLFSALALGSVASAQPGSGLGEPGLGGGPRLSKYAVRLQTRPQRSAPTLTPEARRQQAIDRYQAGKLSLSDLDYAFGGRQAALEHAQRTAHPAFGQLLNEFYRDSGSTPALTEMVKRLSKDSDAQSATSLIESYAKGRGPELRRALVEAAAEGLEGSTRRRDGPAQAARLLAGQANRDLAGESKNQGLTPTERSMRALDFAADQLTQGRGSAASKILEAESKRFGELGFNRSDPEGRLLQALSQNLQTRAAATQETVGFEQRKNIKALAQQARDLRALADRLERSGNPADAASLRTIAQDTRNQAALYDYAVRQQDQLVDQALAQTYENMVMGMFDHKIAAASNWFGKQDKLKQDKAKIAHVFKQLRERMAKDGTGLDRAWNDMFNDRYSAPLGSVFPTAGDGAAFLRDHELSAGMVALFADMATGIRDGQDKRVDDARAKLVKLLRDKRLWPIAEQVLKDSVKQAKSKVGKDAFKNLTDNARGEWWKQRAGDFVAEDLPILVASGLVSGGTGTIARAGVGALGWGSRAMRVAQVGTELLTFVPAEKLIREAATGEKSDWSPGAVARDYAFTLAGYGLFRALGKGWQHLRTPKTPPVKPAAPPSTTPPSTSTPKPVAPKPSTPQPTASKPGTGSHLEPGNARGARGALAGEEAGTAAKLVRDTKPGSNRPAGLTKARAKARQGKVDMPAEQVQHAYKHAKDFGIKGDPNTARLKAFQQSMRNHIADARTKPIKGTYRGDPVTHYVNPETGLNVIAKPNGEFLSGWKLSPDQLKHVLKHGKLGGG